MHLGRLPEGPLNDPIDLLDARHGKVVSEAQELVGEGIRQRAHHGTHHLVGSRETHGKPMENHGKGMEKLRSLDGKPW